MNIEPQNTVKGAVDQVLVVMRARIGEPYEAAAAALTRIGELQLDAKNEARVIGELTDLAGELFESLFQPWLRVKRLSETLERFERRVAGESP